MIKRLIQAIARPPVRWCKAVGRRLERRQARRISERYADEITQFAELAKAVRDLEAKLTLRLDRQEGFNWDHVALARRLGSLEDHMNRILDQENFAEGEPGRGFVCLASEETLAATTALATLEKAG